MATVQPLARFGVSFSHSPHHRNLRLSSARHKFQLRRIYGLFRPSYLRGWVQGVKNNNNGWAESNQKATIGEKRLQHLKWCLTGGQATPSGSMGSGAGTMGSCDGVEHTSSIHLQIQGVCIRRKRFSRSQKLAWLPLFRPPSPKTCGALAVGHRLTRPPKLASGPSDPS